MDFPLIGWNLKVSLLLAGLVKLVVDDRKDLSIQGVGLKYNSVDYSVRVNLTYSVITKNSFFENILFESTKFVFKNHVP